MTASPPRADPGAGVDSGVAWRVAIGAALASGTGFGTTYTFGAFFDSMADDFGSGRGATALVFGVTLFLFFGLGVVSGPLADRVGPRRLVVTGAILMAAGLVATSKVDGVAAGYLTYGLGVGVGGGLIVTPMYATAGGWFVRRRAVAMGVVASGNGLGTLVLVPVSEALIDHHGWRTAYVLLAAGVAVLFGIAALLVAAPPIPPPPPPFAQMRAVGAMRPFQLLFGTGLLFSVALFIAFAFVVDFATDDGVPSDRAALLVGIIGATSILGRLGITSLAVRWPATRLLQSSAAALPLAFAVWATAGGRYWQLVLFAGLLGVAYGGFVALGPEVAAVLFGTAGLGAIIGLQFLGAGLGGLVGPPVAGVLADRFDGQTVPIGFALFASVLTVALSLAIPTHASTPDGA